LFCGFPGAGKFYRRKKFGKEKIEDGKLASGENPEKL
jgi:hypothetical protein